MRTRIRRLLAAMSTATALAVAAPIADAAPFADAAPPAAPAPAAGGGFSPTANPSSFPLADPDTVRAKDGRYVTYGTTVPAGRGKRCGGATGRLYVPVLVHGSGNTVGMTDCASDSRWARAAETAWS